MDTTKINYIFPTSPTIPMNFRQTLTYLLHGFMLGFRVEHSVLVWIWLNIVGWIYLLAYLNSTYALSTPDSSLYTTIAAISLSSYFFIFGLGYFVWAWLGGSLYRSMAVQLVGSQKITLLQQLRFGWMHYVHFFCGPVLLWIDTGIIISLTYYLIILAKIALSWPIFGIIVCIIVGLIVPILGVISSWMILNCLGLPGMMYASIAMEGNDHYDATSRALTYLWSRIGNFLLYHIVLLVLVIVLVIVLAVLWYCIFFLCYLIPHPTILSFILTETTMILLSILISCYAGGKIAIYNLIRQQHENLPLGIDFS